jgi:FixJ family two-component response regulator
MQNARRFVVAVVDDDIRVLDSIENFLMSAGHKVRPFSSPRAFLDNEALKEVDCVISDIGMPLMDGFELRRRVGVLRPDLPVIFISGLYDLRLLKVAGLPSDQIFLRKPFNAGELLGALGRLLSP